MRVRVELVAYIDGMNRVVGDAIAEEDGTISNPVVVDSDFLKILKDPPVRQLVFGRRD